MSSFISFLKKNYIQIGIPLLLTIKYTIFWKESILMAHGSEVLYRLVDTEYFSFNHDRWGMLPTQIIPLLMVKLNTGISTIAFAQSISFLIYDLFFYGLLFYALKDTKNAVLLFFISLIPSVFLYYLHEWAIFIGINFGVLLLSFIENKYKENPACYLIATVLIFLCVSTHPISLILIITIYLLNIKKLGIRGSILFFLSMLITIGFSVFNDGYESDKATSGILSGMFMITKLPELITKYTGYFGFMIAIISIILIVWNRKSYQPQILLILYLAGIIGFMLISILHTITHPYIEEYMFFYTEGSLLPSVASVLLVATSLTFNFRKFLNMLFIISVMRFGYLNFGNNIIHDYVINIEEKIEFFHQKFPNKKVIVLDKETAGIDMYNYYLHFQSFILSQNKYKKPVVLYRTDVNKSFEKDGELVFVNSFYRDTVDLNEYMSYKLYFNPESIFKKYNVSAEDIVMDF